ncbi:MAG: ROK family protein, partial [Eubacteriales bacterium]
LCISVYAESGRRLGQTLSLLIDILNPELIVIGGVFMRSSDLLLPYALEVIEKEALSYSARAVRIVPAALGERIGDYAAVSLIAGDTRLSKESCVTSGQKPGKEL